MWVAAPFGLAASKPFHQLLPKRPVPPPTSGFKTDDMMSGWVYVTRGTELMPIRIDGVDVWKHEWERIAIDAVPVQDPVFGRTYHFQVYEIRHARRTIVFAAGEFSNGIWGFFQPRSSEE